MTAGNRPAHFKNFKTYKMATNTDPFAPWNDPMYKNDPFAAHNDPMHRNDPFKPWNNNFGNESDLNDRERESYNLPPIRTHRDRDDDGNY